MTGQWLNWQRRWSRGGSRAAVERSVHAVDKPHTSTRRKRHVVVGFFARIQYRQTRLMPAQPLTAGINNATTMRLNHSAYEIGVPFGNGYAGLTSVRSSAA